MKFVSVILSPEAEEVYNYLNNQASASKQERMILKAINQKIELIKANIPITENLLEKIYFQRNTLKNTGQQIYFM